MEHTNPEGANLVSVGIDVLNAGRVKLIDHMGGDASVVRYARRCYQSEERSEPDSDRRLIRHLLKQEHMTPFESFVLTFDVKAPIFISRQWLRHRMSSPMEKSLRYCTAETEFYIPEDLQGADRDDWIQDHSGQFGAYHHYVKRGRPKEQARSVLPLGTYTEFYWTVNGSSLINFLKLRMSTHAQREMQEYAQAVLELSKLVAPITMKEWSREDEQIG